MRIPIKRSAAALSPNAPALSELLRRLVAAYDPERVYLFGSAARGAAGPDSDYDLMIIVPDDAPKERRRSRLAYQAMRGAGTAADVLVWLKSNFERRAHVVASLPATVLREGKLLYGR
jgi:predicted nucleotidyltransferase